MTPPTERRPAIDATNAPSAGSSVDETAPAGASVAGTAVTGFGPPTAAGEVGTLGPYRVVKELGKGGMGAVYAAIDTRLDRRLALKVMLPQFAADTAARERFLREARAAARVKHDNVVTVYEADERNGVPYIAMEYLEGYPLDEFLKKKGNPTPAQVLKLAAETAAGLAAAHRQGLVHRDVKPGNLWLEAPAGRVKVLDFGLARPVDAEVELTKSGAIVGTPAYMSPEQARGEKVDHRTDLFSLGALLYRLVTGRLPFQAPNTMAMLIALGTEDPPPVRDLNAAVPEELAALIHQLLAKSADARPASADEVVKRVRAIVQGQTAARARALEQSTSQPQVIPSVVLPVPLSMMAPPANPFTDLDALDSVTDTAAMPEAAPVGRKPGGRWLWAAAGLAGMVLLALGGVIIIIRNKDGSETKIEVPDGATVTVKEKDGKTLAQVGPSPKVTPAADDSADRKAAEWVIAQGGTVGVHGGDPNRFFLAVADLPRDRFTLRTVDLRKTKVTDAELASLKGCSELEGLTLSEAQTGEGLSAFPKLTWLDITRAKVTDAGLTSLRELKRLQFLKASDTVFSDVSLSHLKGHGSLRGLELDGTSVSDAGLAHLDGLPALETLLLDRTSVTGAGLGPLAGLKKLSMLSIGGAKGTSADLSRLKDLPQLRHLSLSGTTVTDAVLAELKAHAGLTRLGLGGTSVTDAGLAHLPEFKTLGWLWVGSTNVTDKGLAHLKDCKKLTTLVMHKTGVTWKGLADFHTLVPGCHIEHDAGVIEAIDVDRKTAEWVISRGGTVQIRIGPDVFKLPDGNEYLNAVGALPRERFTLSRVTLDREATDADLENLKGCGHLNVLGLSGTKVTGSGLASISSARQIHLSESKVTDAGLAPLRQMKGLIDLNLHDTGIGDNGLVHLKGHETLAMLFINKTKVTDAGLAHLSGNTGIRDLGIWDTGVTDAGLAHLKGYNNLQRLWLDGTGVTDAGLAHIQGCKALTYLGVKRTAVSAKGLADFHAAVPACRIEHDGGVIEPIDVERRAAEHMLSLGGTISVKGDGELLNVDAVPQLPKERFALASVWLNDKAVTDADLARLDACKNLTWFRLSGKSVTEAGLVRLKSWPRLSALHLNGAGVTDAGLKHVAPCGLLTTIGLSDSAVTDAGLAQLAGFKALTQLDLDATKVTDAGLKQVANFSGLTSLKLDKTAVTDAGLANLKTLTKLRRLELGGTPITGTGLVHIRDCQDLGHLLLWNTKVTDDGLAHLRGLNMLRILQLQGTPVTDAGMAHLSGLKALDDLHLGQTPVGDAGMAHLKGCTALRFLMLDNSKVTDAGLVELVGCKNLRGLDVSGTRVTAKGLADFHAAVPGCRVAHDGGTIEPRK